MSDQGSKQANEPWLALHPLIDVLYQHLQLAVGGTISVCSCCITSITESKKSAISPLCFSELAHEIFCLLCRGGHAEGKSIFAGGKLADMDSS